MDSTQSYSLNKKLNYSNDKKIYLLHNDIYYEFIFGDIRTNLLLKKSSDYQLCIICGETSSLNFAKAAKKQMLRHLIEFHNFKIIDELPENKIAIKIESNQTFGFINNSVELNESLKNNLNIKPLTEISNEINESSDLIQLNSFLENGLANDENNVSNHDSSNINGTNLLIMNDKLNINSSIRFPKKKTKIKNNQLNKNSSKNSFKNSSKNLSKNLSKNSSKNLSKKQIDLTNNPIDLSTNSSENKISLEVIKNKKSAKKIANQLNSNGNQSTKNQIKRKINSDQTKNRIKKAKLNQTPIQTDDNEINLLNYNRFVSSDSSNLLNSQIYQNTFGIELKNENKIYNPLFNSLLLNCLNNSNDLFNLNNLNDSNNSINIFSSFINSLNNEKVNQQDYQFNDYNQQDHQFNNYIQHNNQLAENQESICLNNLKLNLNDYSIKDEFDEKILSLEIKLTNIEKDLIIISNDYRSTKDELLELINDRNNLKNRFINQLIN